MKTEETEETEGVFHTQLLKQVVVKAPNKRIIVEVYYDVVEGKSIFHLLTRKLHDFKTREIVQHEMVLSAETMCILGDILFENFLDNKQIRDLIVQEVDEGKSFKAEVFINPLIK